MRDDRVRLGDILEAIERIEKYAGQRRDALYSDELVQTWVVHHLMIIGEACRTLSAEFRAAHSEDVWVLAAGLRNVLVHEYFGEEFTCNRVRRAGDRRDNNARSFWRVQQHSSRWRQIQR